MQSIYKTCQDNCPYHNSHNALVITCLPVPAKWTHIYSVLHKWIFKSVVHLAETGRHVITGLTKTCRDTPGRRDSKWPGWRRTKWTDRLLGGCRAGTPACHGVLNAVTLRDALLADAGTTKQGRVGNTCTKWTLASDRRRDRCLGNKTSRIQAQNTGCLWTCVLLYKACIYSIQPL